MLKRAQDIWWEKHGNKYWSLYPSTPTNAQKRIIYECVKAYEKGYQKIVIHAGVGIGKSAIATTLMRIFYDSYILTKDTHLQDQYLEDHDDCLVELKGRSHYNCHYGGTCNNCYINYVNEHMTPNLKVRLKLLNTHGRYFEYAHPLDEIFNENGELSDLDEYAQRYWEKVSEMKMWYCNDCEYQKARKKAKDSRYTVANYHSLYFNSSVYPFFQPRESIFFDECHNIEKLVADWFNISINPATIYEKFDIDIFEDKLYSELDDINYWTKIFEEIILKLKIQEKSEISKYKGILDDNYIDVIKKDYADERRKYYGFIDLLQNEYCVVLPKEDDIYDDSRNNILLQPVFSKDLTNVLFRMGGVCFFLSGTLPDYEQYFYELGLDMEDVYYIHEDSPYPEENRPIIFEPLGKFSSKYNHYENGRYVYAYEHPSVIHGLKNILDNHPNENVIIFTESYDQTDYLYDELYDYQPLKAYGEFRDENIDLFKECSEYNLLISPSISEGVDFKGKYCTVQIIFKVPYPVPLGRIKYRLNRYHDWDYYNNLVLIKLEQMYGRSIRGSGDKCVTYIVDGAFDNLLKKSRFSNYFQSGLRAGKLLNHC